MRRINRLHSTGTGGLPTDLDFQRQIDGMLIDAS
jgi:hypothetical protein